MAHDKCTAMPTDPQNQVPVREPTRDRPTARWGEPYDSWWAELSAALPWAIPMVLAVALFGHGLARWRLWEAEIFTLQVARRPLGQLLEQAAQDVHPPLQYLIPSQFVMHSTSDWLLRVPSFLALLGAVWLLMVVARRDLGADHRSLAGLLLATSPFAVLYAGSGRAYALLILLGVGLYWASGEVARGPRPGWGAAALGVLASAGLYTHYAMAAPILGASLAVLVGSRSRHQVSARRRIALGAGALLLAGLSFLPWLSPLAHQIDDDQKVARTKDVLAYLLWPLVRYVPLASWCWLALATTGLVLVLWRRRGMRAFVLAWVAAAVLGPIALATSADMVRRLYVHAGFLAPMALLVAAGLRGPERVVQRWLPTRLAWLPLAATPLLILHAFPIARTLSLPSSPFGFTIPDGEKGVYDSRQEIAVIAAAMGSEDRIVLPKLSSSQRYHHQRAKLNWGECSTAAQTGDWVGLPAPDRGEGKRWEVGEQQREQGCVMAWAFPFMLELPNDAACERLLEEILTSTAREAHGPFLLELAAAAHRSGDQAAAMDYASKAVESAPAWPMPALFLAELQLEEGEAQQALVTAGRGLVVAGRWHPEAAPALREQRTRALKALGRRGEIPQEQVLADCAARTVRAPAARQRCFLDVFTGDID